MINAGAGIADYACDIFLKMRLADDEDTDRLIKLAYALHMLIKLQFRPESDLEEPVHDLAVGEIGTLEVAAKRYVDILRLYRRDAQDRNCAHQKGAEHEPKAFAQEARVEAERGGEAIHDQ